MIKEKIAKLILKILFYFTMFIILFPIIILIVFSFNSAVFPGFPWAGFTIKWYVKLFSDSLLLNSIKNSIVVGFFVGLISTIIGFFGAMTFQNTKSKFMSFYKKFSFLPPLVPFILSGIAFVTYLNYLPLNKSITSIIIFQSVIFFPIALGIISLKLNEIPYNYLLATRNLGGSFKDYLIKILLPLLKNTLLGTFLLIFALSWDEFVISWFVSSFDQTIPIRIWTLLKSSIDPSINALGTISLLISSILLLIAIKLLLKKEDSKNE